MASSGDACGRELTRVLRASIGLLALLALAACGAPGHHAASSTTPTTDSGTSSKPAQAVLPAVLNPDQVKPAAQKLFAPYDKNGHLTVQASEAGSGSCFATSIAVPVAGVFRCLSANTILDPCFAPVHESSPAIVTCFADPWSEGQTIRLGAGLPAYDPVLTAGDPWAIELTSGVRCVSVTGAVPALGTVNLTYRCDGSMAAGITSGDNGTLVAHYGPVEGPLTDVAVATAWRGRSFRIGGTA